MSATTPVYGWPYQTRTDAPDGPLLGANLALAVEATLRGVDLRTATLERSIPRTVADAAARNAIATPPPGLIVYRLDVGITEIYTGTVWKPTPGTLIGHFIASIAQSIPNNAVTVAALDGADVVDIYGAHDSVVNNSRFVAPFDGKFVFSGGSGSVGNATGVRSILWTKNGVANVVAGGQSQWSVGGAATPHSVPARTISVPMVAGDFVELALFQNSGGALNTNLGNGDAPYMLVTYGGG